MGGYERVPIEDWQALTDHLRKFAGEGETSESARGGKVNESAEGIEVTVGSGQFSVTRDGRVEAGMPLHAFEDGGVEALYFDHESETIRVEGGDRSYEFRKPS